MKCSILFPLLTFLFNHHLASSAGLTAINDSFHAGQLYLQVRHATHVNPTPDPVIDLNTRNILCNDVLGSPYFSTQGIQPDDYNELVQGPEAVRRYAETYFRAHSVMAPEHIRTRNSIPRPYILANFKFQGFVGRTYMTAYPLKEYVLVCLAKKPFSDDLVPYYVSRRYNLVRNIIGTNFYKPGRFIFKPITDGLPTIALAEVPARTDTSIDHSVELHYIQIRRDNTPEQNHANDPICQLIPMGSHHNQHERLCVAVLASSFFEGRDRYPRKPRFEEGCSYQEVSFQTYQAQRIANGTYNEWMIRCEAVVTRNVYYISRAYSTNRVFVYSMNSTDGKVYLENLSTNVVVADNGNRQHMRRRTT